MAIFAATTPKSCVWDASKRNPVAIAARSITMYGLLNTDGDFFPADRQE